MVKISLIFEAFLENRNFISWPHTQNEKKNVPWIQYQISNISVFDY